MLSKSGGSNYPPCHYYYDGRDENPGNTVGFRNRNYRILESYSLEESEAKIHILTDEISTLYYIEEPKLSDEDRSFLCSVRANIPRILLRDRSSCRDCGEGVEYLIEEFLREWDGPSPERMQTIKYYLKRDLRGYGIIDPMMRDSKLEDISCTGPGIPIYVYHRSYGNMESNRMFHEKEMLDSFVIYLSQKGGKMVTVSDPILDSTTPEGNRVNAAFGKEVTSRGSMFSIRLFRKVPFTPADLVRLGTASPELLSFLWIMTEWRKNILIIGESGAGKTSTLNALSYFIPPRAKIVSIEDTREINIPHKNWIPAVTRGVRIGGFLPSEQGAEVVDMFDLVRVALRQRPEYLIVGEIRGREAFSLFQAMSTGQTTFATVHAGSLPSLINRLENPPLNVPSVMLSSVDLVVKVSLINTAGRIERKITSVTGITGFDIENGNITAQNVYEWNQQKDEFEFLYPRPYLKMVAEGGDMDEENLLNNISLRARIIEKISWDKERETGFQESLDSYHFPGTEREGKN